jgi:hypothetical protein
MEKGNGLGGDKDFEIKLANYPVISAFSPSALWLSVDEPTTRVPYSLSWSRNEAKSESAR